MMDCLDMPDEDDLRDGQVARFYTANELDKILAFRSELRSINSTLGSFADVPSEAWGVREVRGCEHNSWDTVDATDFKVRGPKYFVDKVKVMSKPAIAELAVVDFFESTGDIERVARCAAAGTVQRLRAGGETRKLVMINFRIVPLQLVAVWTLPAEFEKDPASVVAARLATAGAMDGKEMSQRLKVIPRVLAGPWVALCMVGETPGMLAKNIPVSYYDEDGVLEISVQIASSGTAARMCRVLRPMATGLSLELCLLLQSQRAEELPERILGGLRVVHPDPMSVRKVDP